MPAPDEDAIVAGRLETLVAPSCRNAKVSRFLGLVMLDGRGGGVDRLSRWDE